MKNLSYQLYSSREFHPLDDTLTMLADLGYTQVEGYGDLYVDPAGLKAALQSAGLSMPSGHFSLDMLENDPQQVIDIAQTLGMQAVYCPHIAADFRPVDGPGWRAFGERVESAGEAVRNAGLIYGWHNHDFEFIQQADGSMPMAEIFAGGPGLSWEADIAWIIRGGGDPLQWITRFGNRISSVHVKDIAPSGENADEDGWADVGHGVVDWKSIFDALNSTPASLFVMEHDKPSDHRRFAARSIKACREMGV